MPVEPTPSQPSRWPNITRDFERQTAMNAVVAWLFAVTGPLAILLAAQSSAKIDTPAFVSWVFGAHAVGGVLSIAMSLLYRQPIAMAWSIPAAVLAASALGHLPMSEIVGAYVVAGVVIMLVGFSGWLKTAMRYLPAPIVMGMVCGVFLPFALKIMAGFEQDALIAAAVTAGFVLTSALPRLGAIVPPVLMALMAGLLVLMVDGQATGGRPLQFAVAEPQLFWPQFSTRAILELVIPLVITVIGIHNPQGFAVLAQAKHEPPVNAMTIASGAGSIVAAIVGAGPACVAGPSNAYLCSAGAADRRYVGGVIYGLLMLSFGLAAPFATSLGANIPAVFIGVLGGLAMLRPLQGWLATAFAGQLGLGALVAFLVAFSNVSLLHIAAPFWALVAGVATSALLEASALRSTAKARAG